MSFDTIERIEIGLLLFGFVLPPHLYNGITFANLIASGKVPVWKHLFIILLEIGLISPLSNIIILIGISSGPPDLLESKDKIPVIDHTSLGSVSANTIELEILFLK